MLLAEDVKSNSNHPYLYARVLKVFHINVIYTGGGRLDYRPRRLDVLWVRWFRYTGSTAVCWGDHQLDLIHFPPMGSEKAFDFIDPKDVLRACYIAPAFAKGKAHPDGIGLSRCANDAQEWCGYYVNR